MAGIGIILFVGLRREVGGDWDNYLLIFEWIGDRDLGYALTKTEPGYGLLNWIATRAGWGIWFPNLICAALFTWGLIAFCRLQPNVWLAIAVAVPYFIVGVAMGFTRQSAAIGFVMLALAQLTRGRTVRSLVYLAFAPLFHSSALVVFPIFGLALARSGFITVLMFILVAAFAYVQLSGQLFSKLQLYTTREYEGAGALPRLAMNFLPSVLFLSLRRYFTADPAQLRLWTIFALASVLAMILALFIDATVIVDRLGIYLIPVQIFVLARLPMTFRGTARESQLLLAAILLYSLTIEVVWLNYGRWTHAWVPYKNYLVDAGTPRLAPLPRSQ